MPAHEGVGGSLRERSGRRTLRCAEARRGPHRRLTSPPVCDATWRKKAVFAVAAGDSVHDVFTTPDAVTVAMTLLSVVAVTFDPAAVDQHGIIVVIPSLDRLIMPSWFDVGEPAGMPYLRGGRVRVTWGAGGAGRASTLGA